MAHGNGSPAGPGWPELSGLCAAPGRCLLSLLALSPPFFLLLFISPYLLFFPSSLLAFSFSYLIFSFSIDFLDIFQSVHI